MFELLSPHPHLPWVFQPHQDEESVEFDNLMRAGDTVKMSLTPDRLRTMDVRPFYLPFAISLAFFF